MGLTSVEGPLPGSRPSPHCVFTWRRGGRGLPGVSVVGAPTSLFMRLLHPHGLIACLRPLLPCQTPGNWISTWISGGREPSGTASQVSRLRGRLRQRRYRSREFLSGGTAPELSLSRLAFKLLFVCFKLTRRNPRAYLLHFL